MRERADVAGVALAVVGTRASAATRSGSVAMSCMARASAVSMISRHWLSSGLGTSRRVIPTYSACDTVSPVRPSATVTAMTTLPTY